MSLSDGVALVISAAFLLAGILNVAGPAFVVAEFRNWGYPRALRVAVGVCEWAVAAAMWVPTWREWAAYGGVCILLGVLFSLGRSRAWLRMEYPLALLSLCALLAVSPCA